MQKDASQQGQPGAERRFRQLYVAENIASKLPHGEFLDDGLVRIEYTLWNHAEALDKPVAALSGFGIGLLQLQQKDNGTDPQDCVVDPGRAIGLNVISKWNHRLAWIIAQSPLEIRAH